MWLSCRYTGTYTKCLNLGSYNYLGFAEASGPCADAAVAAINTYGCAMCSPIQELGKSFVNRGTFLLINYALIFSHALNPRLLASGNGRCKSSLTRSKCNFILYFSLSTLNLNHKLLKYSKPTVNLRCTRW